MIILDVKYQWNIIEKRKNQLLQKRESAASKNFDDIKVREKRSPILSIEKELSLKKCKSLNIILYKIHKNMGRIISLKSESFSNKQ